MRVLTFIVRFLGISAILLYCCSAFAQENNQDITVNFPDEMEVTGTVSIDPGMFEPTDPDLVDVAHFQNPVTNDGTGTIKIYDGRNQITSRSYIGNYSAVIDFSNYAWDSGNRMQRPFNYSITIDLPKFEYTELFNDLNYCFFGSNTSSNIFKPFDQLKNGRYFSVNNSLGFSVTDFTGSGNWSIDCKTPYAFSTNNPIFTSGGASNLPVLIQTIVAVLAWVGVAFSIINTVRNG